MIKSNAIQFTGLGSRNGMELDSVNGLKVIENTIDGGTSNITGEGISFTSQNVLISGNRISGTQASGILSFLVTGLGDSDQIITNNVISNAMPAIQLGWPSGSSNVVAKDILVAHNITYNSSLGFQTYFVGAQNPGANNVNVIYNNWNNNVNGLTYSLECCGVPINIVTK